MFPSHGFEDDPARSQPGQALFLVSILALAVNALRIEDNPRSGAAWEARHIGGVSIAPDGMVPLVLRHFPRAAGGNFAAA